MRHVSRVVGLLCIALCALGCSGVDGAGGSPGAAGMGGLGGSAGVGAAGAGGAAGMGGAGGEGGSGGALPPAEFVSFSGTLGSVTDSFGGAIVSAIGIDATDPAPTWVAAWDRSSITPLGTSTVSFDSETGSYEVFLYYESAFDGRNAYGRQLQGVNGTTLEISADGGSDTVSGVSSTFLKTAADRLVMRVHFIGSATDSFGEFNIDFFSPVASTTNAFTYSVDDVDDGVVISIDTSELSAFGDSVASALGQSGLDEDLVNAVAEALVGQITDDVATAEASLLVSGQDEYLDAITEVLGIVNTLMIDGTPVFNFTQSDATIQTLLTGDTGTSAMTFSLTGLGLGTLENTAFLDYVDSLLVGGEDGSAPEAFTPDALTDDQASSLIELLTLSVEQGTDNTDTQGTFAVQLEVDGIVTENFAGSITDVSTTDQ